jgi:hypothetical protein
MLPRWNWDSPIPTLANECAPPLPPGPGEGGGTLAVGGRGVGVPIPTTGENDLPTLYIFLKKLVFCFFFNPAVKGDLLIL